MTIEKLDGTSPRLYTLVAPLVMRRSVLRQNNNYPFWTSRSHTWFVAWEGENVYGFVPVEKVVANSYNPNVVAPPEMKLLELSIWEDGYTMPCVCYYDAEKDLYELVDGYHRYLVLKRSKRIYERERGLLPVAVIEKDISNRMASTIRHNRARGTHNVELMSEIVAELTRAQMSDQWIMRHIGMDRDELLRLKQITGLAELFADKEFSPGDTEDEAVEPARIMR